MGSVRERKGQLFFDFRFNGVRCREQTLLEDTPANRKRMETFMDQIDREIKQGGFQYEKYFPNSRNLDRLVAPVPKQREKDVVPEAAGPLFKEFASEWYLENEVAWKISYQKTIRGNVDKYLNPRFGEIKVSHITKGDILKFRSSLAKVLVGKQVGLSPSRINHIMTTLRQILNDAADRSNFSTPFVGIKPLKVPRTEVDPFSIEEVNLILSKVRNDLRTTMRCAFSPLFAPVKSMACNGSMSISSGARF